MRKTENDDKFSDKFLAMKLGLSICIASGPARRDLEPIIQQIMEFNSLEQLRFVVVFDGWEPPKRLMSRLNKMCDLTYEVNEVAKGHIFCRNLQAEMAETELVAFLDDDLSDISINVSAISKFFSQNPHVHAIRGRLSAANRGRLVPPHWNRGNKIVASSIDLEGLSVFRRQVLIEHGGFRNPSGDVVSHEGIDLTWKIALEHGPRSTAYYPSLNAKHPVRSEVLSSRKDVKPKLEGPVDVTPQEVNSLYHSLREEDFDLGKSRKLTYGVLSTSASTDIWAESYLNQLKKQTSAPDEIVFVSDEAKFPVGFEKRLRDLGVERTKFIRTSERGRANALNEGMKQIESDIVLVWDVDDVYFPYRIAWTIWQFEKRGGENLDFVAGSMIKEGSNNTRWPQKPVSNRESLLLSLLQSQVPGPFPAGAFRRATSPKPFRVSAKAAVDVHWYVDNLKHWRRAHIDPEPLLFYRKSGGQMSSRFAISQSKEKEKAVERLRLDFAQHVSNVYFKNKGTEIYDSLIAAFNSDNKPSESSPQADEVLNSLSWKITAPLRRIEDRLNLIPILVKIKLFFTAKPTKGKKNDNP